MISRYISTALCAVASVPFRSGGVAASLQGEGLGDDGECWPSVNKIAGDIKLSPATVRRAIKDLKKVGLIETKQRYREHGGKSSLLYKMFNRQK